ncbi:SpoIID/LytB domain-containing protein [Thermus sediminis]|uniref:SpoIID/LytB domain-containing protein n=1 Tax=Thermus sediminis TaxID=1761908 RepID=UPI000E3C1844|nr:SpoIID/LytB domain-containing protein [Thermus sediminis]
MKRLAFLPLVLLSLLSARSQEKDLLLRVLLREVPPGEEVVLKTPEGEVRARAGGEGVVVDGRVYPYLDLNVPHFALGGRAYRGGVRLFTQEGRLLVVNLVLLEDYLLGVLPGEMPEGFPMEALKAQAVAARTFAVYRLNPRAPYDLCPDVHCQVYQGLSAERPRHQEAVAATRGQVLSFGGQAISALYHADSGGMTAGSEEVFQRALPYLRPRPDPYTRMQPWRLLVSPTQAQRALLSLGLAPRGQDPPQVLERSPSGRASRVRLLGVEVRGPEAQRLLRLMGLPSALVDFQGFEAVGQGAGHGVGLSQWGARGMAEAGFGYREILGHYFPGTFLSDLLIGQASAPALALR